MLKLKLENINKTFDGKNFVVKNFNLEVNNEDFVVLVGPSGCGKTTVLNIIAGLENQTSGNVYIEDKLVNNVDPKNRDIAMVFQNYALYPMLTVYDNLSFSLKIRKMKKNHIYLLFYA
jgi:multiple sugar transport system ATP-binding protein